MAKILQLLNHYLGVKVKIVICLEGESLFYISIEISFQTLVEQICRNKCILGFF